MMRAGFVFVLLASTFFLTLVSQPASAAWPPFGRALSTAADLQGFHRITADGAGGAIVTWQDRRSLPFNVYVQHVLASGNVDAAWPTDGLALMADPAVVPSVTEGSEIPAIIPDGAGGAFVTWPDARSDLNGLDIFVHHVLATGTLDGVWPANGLTVCATTGQQNDPVIVSDGAGGAIITWVDGRSGATVNDLDLYAQHMLASGIVDPSWPANGAPVVTAPKAQVSPAVVGDGAGGAIVTWSDLRSGNPGIDIYAQHLLSSGVVDPAWPASGFGVCTAPGTQSGPGIISDGGSGAVVAWTDTRDGTNEIFAQRVLISGAIAPGWPVNGRAVSVGGTDEVLPRLVPDGAGGAVVAWSGGNSGHHNIRAQHLLASGVLDAAWPVGGASLSFAPSEETNQDVVSDGAGGAIVTWQVSQDIEAQHVLASGALDPAYPVNGRALCALPSTQHNPAIVAAGVSGAIVSWMDRRDGDDDIYALQVLEAGTTDVGPAAPVEIAFSRPSPNPARSAVALRFALPRDTRVRLAIYDASGRRVRDLTDGAQTAGEHAMTWDLRDDGGRSVDTGLYFVRLEADGRTIAHKLVAFR